MSEEPKPFNPSCCSKNAARTVAFTMNTITKVVLSLPSRFVRAEWSAPAISLIALVALFSLFSEAFRRPENFYNIGLQAPITVIIAVGQTLVIAAGGIDLSVGSVLALASVNAAWLINRGCDPAVGLLAAILTGCVCGAINGTLVTVGRLPPFVATLGMMSVARGLAHLISKGVSIFIPSSWFWSISSQQIGFLPLPFIIAMLVALIGHVILAYMRLGRYLYAVGGSYEAARLSGVPVKLVLVAAFILCGLCTGIAAVVEASRVTIGSPMSGIMYELHAIAACVIGGASLSGGRGTIVGTLAGALLMAVLRNGCDALNLRYEYQQIVIGVAVIVAVLYDRWRHASRVG
ncbi:MAG: ABC transporter permease [Armatimonadota bacterium]|nr:ABC transporter permease [Armatimonadota bacterium]MCX7778130.1 ABC transporter permease [Armatimonadota bacterium]MDW8024842.1 ABC transporter permease [Armatimonadota bacterium]